MRRMAHKVFALSTIQSYIYSGKLSKIRETVKIELNNRI